MRRGYLIFMCLMALFHLVNVCVHLYMGHIDWRPAFSLVMGVWLTCVSIWEYRRPTHHAQA